MNPLYLLEPQYPFILFCHATIAQKDAAAMIVGYLLSETWPATCSTRVLAEERPHEAFSSYVGIGVGAMAEPLAKARIL